LWASGVPAEHLVGAVKYRNSNIEFAELHAS
jgi:hypothetical protein